MRQVQQVEHPENQCIAYGHQSITAAQHQPIDDLLDECRQHMRYSFPISTVLLRYRLCQFPSTPLRRPTHPYVALVLSGGVLL
jgi:hypothetical protein